MPRTTRVRPTRRSAVDAGGKIDAEENDDAAEESYGKGVSERVGHAETHRCSFRMLDADDIRDCGDVVVVEAVAEAEQGCGEEGEIEGAMHTDDLFGALQLRAS